MSTRIKVGVQLHPQHCTIDELREGTPFDLDPVQRLLELRG